MKKMSRGMKRTKMFEQKLMGVVLLLICAFITWLCSTGTTPADQDATAVVLLAPLGLWLLFSKNLLIY